MRAVAVDYCEHERRAGSFLCPGERAMELLFVLSPVHRRIARHTPISVALAKDYQLLLGLTTPWTATDIVMTLDDQRIDNIIAWPVDSLVLCPE